MEKRKKKKIKRVIDIAVVFCVFVGVLFWALFSSATDFNQSSVHVVLQRNQVSKDSVIAILKREEVLKNYSLFSIVCSIKKGWNNIRPGRYEIKKEMDVLQVIGLLTSNKQTEVRLVINKLRLRQDFAKLLSRSFGMDSVHVIAYISNKDSLKRYHIDTTTFLSIIIPNTYFFSWKATLPQILTTLQEESVAFWKKHNRTVAAKTAGLTPLQAYTLASIVEEESNDADEKRKIASVYLNRLHKKIKLQSCPTIKYALKNFALKRILDAHLNTLSPYNTYKNFGLPPGPICTPSIATIDELLQAPNTNYLFFVANSNFDGKHHYSSTYAEHNRYAIAYQKALTEQEHIRDAKNVAQEPENTK